MDIITIIFGKGQNLTFLNMGVRAATIFLIVLILIRIAGRRTFALHAPFDNIIILLLGAILARPVVGASPFGPTIFAGLIIVVLHRLLARLTVKSHGFSRWFKGSKTELYRDGKFLDQGLNYCGVSKDDIHEEVRLKTRRSSLENIDVVYMERNGSMSFIEKQRT